MEGEIKIEKGAIYGRHKSLVPGRGYNSWSLEVNSMNSGNGKAFLYLQSSYEVGTDDMVGSAGFELIIPIPKLVGAMDKGSLSEDLLNEGVNISMSSGGSRSNACLNAETLLFQLRDYRKLVRQDLERVGIVADY